MRPPRLGVGCVLSKLYPVAAAGVLLWRRGPFVVLVCEEGVWLLWCNWDIFNREKKTTIKSVMAWLAMRGRKMKLKMLYIYVYACAYIHICVVVMRPMLLTFNVVHGRCWCPLYHVITLDRHCVCRTASFCI